MADFKKTLGKRIIIGDGVMGTLLQSRVNGAHVPDELNLSQPDLVAAIHEEYAAAGAHFLTTNTFGASPLKLREAGAGLVDQVDRINRDAVALARKVADRHGIWVAGNIGPSGKLIDPLGGLPFIEAVENSAAQAAILADAGVDFILVETMTDIQEFRASVIGVRSACDLPLVASMSFTDGDVSISGTGGEVFAITSDFVGVAAVGANCGHSLENNGKAVKEILAHTSLPVLFQPNAGLPVLEAGRTVFKVDAKAFADFMEGIYPLGVAIIGSCCGSDPGFTHLLARRFAGRAVRPRTLPEGLRLSSRTRAAVAGKDRLFLVGERINPTGRRRLRQELMQGHLATVRRDAREQERLGCDGLDINVNLHGLNPRVLEGVFKAVQNLVAVPLFCDSTDSTTVETFCRLYAGKGVINSISGETKALETLLPLAAKYNMAFVAALLDERGIPDTVRGRLEIADRILQAARERAVPMKNVIFDPLALSAAAEPGQVAVTLETVSSLRETYPGNAIILGISNVSFGLPGREHLNAAFLAMAAARGLDMVIANPVEPSLRHQLLALRVLRGEGREALSAYTAHFSAGSGGRPQPGNADTIREAILDGDVEGGRDLAAARLSSATSVSIIENEVIPAMNEVGRRYESGDYFLPQLIAAADVVRAILPLLKEKLPRSRQGPSSKGILFATVEGDIHDIGKNIIVSILESYNFPVVDLGKDVAAETIVSRAVDEKVAVIGLSTLMTTTIPSLLSTVAAIRAEPRLRDVEIYIGGAVVNQDLATAHGVHTCRDGIEMVKRLQANSD